MSFVNKRMMQLCQGQEGDNRFKTSNVGRPQGVTIAPRSTTEIVARRIEDEEQIEALPETLEDRQDYMMDLTRKILWADRGIRRLIERDHLPIKKIHISSYGKTSAVNDNPWTFQVDLADRLRNVVKLRWVSLNIEYVVPGAIPSIPKLGLIYFDNFPSIGNNQYETTSDGTRYHAQFPILAGTVGTTLNYSYEFPDRYYTAINNSSTFIDTLFIRVFKEDPITIPGNFEQFTDLTYISMEFEVTFIDEII